VGRLILALGAVAAPSCRAGSPDVEVELLRGPATVSAEPRFLEAKEPLPADGERLRLCVRPGPGHHVSGRWTVVTPGGREALVVARAELANGRGLSLVSPSSAGSALCVQPRLGGPLEAPVRRIRVAATAPIVVERVVWESARR
jgi:hypothetical protein